MDSSHYHTFIKQLHEIDYKDKCDLFIDCIIWNTLFEGKGNISKEMVEYYYINCDSCRSYINKSYEFELLNTQGNFYNIIHPIVSKYQGTKREYEELFGETSDNVSNDASKEVRKQRNINLINMMIYLHKKTVESRNSHICFVNSELFYATETKVIEYFFIKCDECRDYILNIYYFNIVTGPFRERLTPIISRYNNNQSVSKKRKLEEEIENNKKQKLWA